MIRLKVKEIAKEKGISQSKLSRLADVNITTIQRIFNSPTTANVNLYTLDRIAKALGVNVTDLIESVPDDEPE